MAPIVGKPRPRRAKKDSYVLQQQMTTAEEAYLRDNCEDTCIDQIPSAGGGTGFLGASVLQRPS